MGYLFIAASVFCSLCIAQLLKIGEQKKHNVLNILVINYGVAFLVSFFTSIEFKDGFSALGDIEVIIFVSVILLGIMFIGNMVLYSRSIDRVGMGISIAAMRTSLVFPIALSIFLYAEFLSNYKYLGIALAFIALYMMLPEVNWKKLRDHKSLLLPLGIFLITGLTDSGLKIFEAEFSQILSEDLFLSGIFLVSFITGILFSLRKGKMEFTTAEIMLGSMVGIVNLYSSIFLLYALKELPGSLVFPLTNIALVVIGTLIGIAVWKDKINKRQLVGLTLSIVSIIILIK
ncbi:hypothetical protein AB2B38_001235 [Balneola sp. MJW-20]|uniref:hypothetical protein n=1 Tax=Gracilimonas aurantiaca TaxID=3234185 RepID=UPI00346780D6